MSKSSLKTGIIVLTLFTAIVHLVVLNMGMLQSQGHIDTLFTLNGLGFLGLLLAYLGYIPFLKGQKKLVSYAFILFTLATIAAFFLFNGGGTLGYITKAVEALLVVDLVMDMRS